MFSLAFYATNSPLHHKINDHGDQTSHHFRLPKEIDAIGRRLLVIYKIQTND